jgi:hypothetical protein
MLTNDQLERAPEDGFSDAGPACTALVPVSEPPQRLKPLRRLSLPDPTFLAHLIATAAQVPQTRQHRRAAQADALSAYQAQRSRTPQSRFRTRQVV